MNGRTTLALRPVRNEASTTCEPPRRACAAGSLDQEITQVGVHVDMAAARPRAFPLRFGEWLVRRGALSRGQLLRALATSHLHDWRIGDAVVVLRFARRSRVEAEAERFDSQRGPRTPDPLLEYRLQKLQREFLPKRRTTSKKTPPSPPLPGRRSNGCRVATVSQRITGPAMGAFALSPA